MKLSAPSQLLLSQVQLVSNVCLLLFSKTYHFQNSQKLAKSNL